MNYGKAIKTAREAAGLTIEQLADKAGYKPGYLETLETENVEQSAIEMASVLRRVAEALSTPVEIITLFGLEDKDIDPKKKEIADILLPSITDIAKELIKNK